MRTRKLSLLAVIASTCIWTASAQDTMGTCAGSGNVACVIPNLFEGQRGILLPTATHRAHFIDPTRFNENFASLNTAIATQLTLLPIASPASGFTSSYDRTTGVRTRTATTFGPILTERGETIGRNKFFLGFTFQRFRFDEIDGQDLGQLPAVFRHEQGPGIRAVRDVITTVNSIDLKIDQFTAFGTIGITNNFDLSVAVPMMDVQLSGAAVANIQRITEVVDPSPAGICPATGTNPCHFFEANPQLIARTFPGRQSEAGVGDVTLRFKYGLPLGETFKIALLTDVRLPTGDERNFLGAGAVGVKPFVAISGGGRIAPHVNIGYQWNGDSVLAGDLVAGTKGSLPNQFFYSVGTDIGISTERLTVAFDLLGQRLIDSPRIRRTSFTAASNLTFPQLETSDSSFNINSAAIGFKLNLVDELLLTANLLFRLNDAGLHQKMVPLIGLSYSF